MSRVRRKVAALALAFSCVTGLAGAQENKAVAVAAFDQAQKLMNEGKVALACAKFAESHRLDPQLGTLLHLADCYEQNGQTASAWASFREASEVAEKRRDPRQEVADERARELEPKVSKLQIDVAEGTDPALRIERNGGTVGSALWNTPLPTDPGTYTISASAPGRTPWSGSVVVRADGSTAVIKIPALEAGSGGSATAAPDAGGAGPAGGENASADSSKPVPWLAIGALGVGVAGVAVGTIFGLSSQSKRDDAEQYCDGAECSDQRGVDLKDEAMQAGNIATVGFIVGGVGLAAGTILWLTQPSENPKAAGFSPRVGLGLGGVRVVQSW